MAKRENWSLKHVADVIREEENQQSWSEMQSVRVFVRESQEPIQRAPVQLSPSRTERWPTKKARYSHSMTYVCGCWRFARHLPCVRLLSRRLQPCLRPSLPPTHAGDVGRRLTAVQSAHSQHMYVAGASGWVTLKQFAGSVIRIWLPGGSWISWAEEMRSASCCPVSGEAIVIRQFPAAQR